MGIVQRITTSTRGLGARRFIGTAHYIGYKDNQKNWINCIIFEKKLTLTLTLTLTGTGTLTLTLTIGRTGVRKKSLHEREGI